MRFDSAEHVAAWRRTGRFPRIHDGVTALLREHHGPRDGVVLDLCSSSGLLARRLADAGYRVVAAQEPTAALRLGQTHGVYDGIPLFDQRIAPGTADAFLAWVAEQQVRAIAARRCFPELSEVLSLSWLSAGLLRAGVRTIVLEGRAPRAGSTHPLATAADEVAALEWFVTEQRGPVVALGRHPAR